MSNNGGLYTWSKTSASNASADNTVNFSEGQAPSSLNDSCRALMSSAAKYRDDISGAIVTSGTSAAYIVTSNQNFDTLADFSGQVIAFSPHVTNAAGPVTMTVDGFANLPVRTSPGKELLAGVLIAGTPYTATYNNTDGSLYLHGYYSNPYNVPFLGGMDFWDTIAPNSSFIFPAGQAISRTVYAAAFARWGTTYGAGDGSTTFNVPDKTGRVSAMKEAASSRLTTAKVGIDGATMGAAGGGAQTLSLANLPPITPAGTINEGSIAITGGIFGGTGTGFNTGGAQGSVIGGTAIVATQTGSSFTGTAGGGTSVPVNVAQPTIICNYIIRIL